MSAQVTVLSVPGSSTVAVGDSAAVTLASTSSAEITVTNLTTSAVTGAASTVASADLTASRAIEANASGKIVASDITTTELGYLDGASSNLQTQLNAKSSTLHTHTLNGLSDVNTTGAATGKVISYSGSGWVPTTLTVPTLWGQQAESTSVKLFEDFLGEAEKGENWYAVKNTSSAYFSNQNLAAEDEVFGSMNCISSATTEATYAVISSVLSKKTPSNGETSIFEAKFKVDNTGTTGEMMISVGGFNANDDWEDKFFGFLNSGSPGTNPYRVVAGYVAPQNWRCAAGNGSNLAPSATATVTITDFTKLNTGDKVNLIATDTTNYNFVCGDQSSVAGTWESTTSNDATATNLMNVINTSSGPSGTRFSATVDGAVVTITQVTTGVAGNTIVTLTDPLDGMSHTNFTGGIDINTGVALVNDTYTRLAIKCVFNTSASRWDATVYVNGTVVSGTSFTIQPTITSPSNNYQLCAQIGNRATNKHMRVDWMMATYTRDAIGYVT